jgi:hypothetical protein
MKLPERFFSRVLLAYLPFMAYPYGFLKSCVAATWIVLFFWGSVLFFWLTRRFFFRPALKHAFFLWLIVWGQAVWAVTKLPPFWILSVFFLTPSPFFDDRARTDPVRIFSKKIPRYAFERIAAGAGFAGFAALLGLIKEVAAKDLGIGIFEQPAGTLLVIAAIAFLWKNQPYQKRG